jgi:putative ABC transport system permease protein
MNWVAWKMLVGDRGKYLATIFGVAFGTLLIAQQTSIFVGLMQRTANQIIDIRDAQIWVMDPKVQNADEIKPLSESDIFRVRGVPAVSWGVKLYKGQARARAEDGSFRQVMLMGLDDETLIGAPAEMLVGTLEDLRRPDAVIIDKAGFGYMWPGEPMEVGKTFEMNDRRATIVGICHASPPFQTFPIMFSRYSQAMNFVAPERQRMSFVLASPRPGVSVEEACRQISDQTGLRAMGRMEFVWQTVAYYMAVTGIPINFGITVLLGFVVGTAIAGQTFYLFVIENLRQFGALKAMGVTNRRLLAMVLLQAGVVGCIGFAVGMGLTVLFFEGTKNLPHMEGFYMPWQVMAGSAVAVALIVVAASYVSARKVLILEPAIVFRA